MTDPDPARGRIAFDGAPTPLKTALFLLVCFAWLLPGLVGHDPWKADEAVAFGAVSEMLRTGDWSRFSIAGEPFTGEAPLFLWTAAAFAKALGGMLPLHDAARLAAGFYVGATLGLLSAAAWELMGERAVRMSVLLFIGCLGLLIRAHEMIADLAGLAAITLGLNGLALSRSPGSPWAWATSATGCFRSPCSRRSLWCFPSPRPHGAMEGMGSRPWRRLSSRSPSSPRGPRPCPPGAISARVRTVACRTS
jgi:hypothetical protein